ncbi:MAG: hypothetical protein IJ466_08715 [Clostridia bacterium]|nr:hypothetical protein [Clostridia bacterium]
MDEHELLTLKSKVDQETAANKAEHSSFKRRLDELEEGSKRQTEILLTMQRQADAIDSINTKIDKMTGSVERVEKRVDEIEREPGEKWKKMAFEIIKYIVLAAVGVAAGYFLK